MAKVTGFGGFFMKTEDPQKTAEWMTNILGVKTDAWGRTFPSGDIDDPKKEGQTVLGLHEQSSDYFGPSKLPFMLNFRVDDLDGVLEDLAAKGVHVIKRLPADAYGQFAHVAGPDGITIELWQPPPSDAGT